MDDVNERAVIGGNFPPEPTREEKHAQFVADVETLAGKGNALPDKVERDEQLEPVIEVVKATKKLLGRLDDTRKAENRPLDEEIKANNAFFNTMHARMKRMAEALEQRVGDYNEAKRQEERRQLAAEAAERQRLADQERDRLAALEVETGATAEGIEAEMAVDRQKRLDDAARAAESAVFRDTGPTRTAAGTVGSKKGFDFRVKDYAKIDLRELKDSFGVEAIDKAIRDHIRRNKNTRPLKGVEIFETSKVNIR